MAKFKVTLSDGTSEYDVRQIRTMINRIQVEQAKRKERLDSSKKMTAYAKDKGVSAAEMKKLTAENYANNQKNLKTLNKVAGTDAFKSAESALKSKAKSLFSGAKDLSPKGGGGGGSIKSPDETARPRMSLLKKRQI